MRIYRILWWAVTILLVLVGVGAAAILLAVPAMLLTFGCAFGIVAAAVGGGPLSDGKPQTGRVLVAKAISKGLMAGVAAVATLGLGSLVGVGVALLVVLLAASSPPAIRFYLQALARADALSAASENRSGLAGSRVNTRLKDRSSATQLRLRSSEPLLPLPKEAWSDEELCLAWRRSFRILQGTSSPTDLARVVEVRQQYLDELERRNPTGLSSWLDSGARAAGNPLKYLQDRIEDQDIE